MKDKVKVAAAQIDIKPLNPEANLARHRQALEEIRHKGSADLVVFPELASSGYVRGMEGGDFPEFSRQYLKVAERIPGPYTDSLTELAREFNCYLVTGISEVHPDIPAVLYNSAVLISPAKGIVGIYRKLQIVREEKHYFFGGSEAEVYPTELGNIGIIICADNVFPEIPRVLALKGAEIICVPYSRVRGIGGDPGLYYSLISSRAYENNCFFIACNRVGSENKNVFEGKSCICGPGGEFLSRSETESEELLIADLLAESLETARLRYARFRDRRPELYQELFKPVEGEVK